jgi:hypothetical protein
MKRLLLLSACLGAGCARGPLEKTMKLSLETRVTEEGDTTVVTASLRNTGTEPARVLREFMLHRTFAILRDAEGKEIRPSRNAAAARGARHFRKPLQVQGLQPGEAVEVLTLTLDRSRRNVNAGDLSWSPEAFRSDVLTAELGYEVDEDAAGMARRLDEPDIAVGRWTAMPVPLSFKK